MGCYGKHGNYDVEGYVTIAICCDEKSYYEITPKKKRNHGYSSSNKKRHSKKAEATLKTAAATPDEDVLTLTGAQLKTLIN